MEYRQLPRGSERERFGVLGLGMGGIGTTPPEEIEAIVRRALEAGINFFDLCTAGATYAPLGRAIRGRREEVFLQMHFGAVMSRGNMDGAAISTPSSAPSFGSLPSLVPTMPISASFTVWMTKRISNF